MLGQMNYIPKRSPQIIAKSTANLKSTLKIDLHDISMLNIILRPDNTVLNDRATWVNRHLEDLCKKINLYIMDHNNPTPSSEQEPTTCELKKLESAKYYVAHF